VSGVGRVPPLSQGLMYAAGDYADPEERVRSWATPTSLRDVDAECRGVITGIYALATAKGER
jgi:hypothetical protein